MLYFADAGGGGRKASPPGMCFRSHNRAVPSLLVVVKFVPVGENSTDQGESLWPRKIATHFFVS